MNTSDSPHVAFRPQARLLSLLGEQMISDQAVGLIELVKNAYDADATHVEIELLGLGRPETTRVIVRDNGFGMTREDVEQKWLSPAVSDKERQKKPDSAPHSGDCRLERKVWAVLPHSSSDTNSR